MHIQACQGSILHWFYSPVSASLRESNSSLGGLLAIKEISGQIWFSFLTPCLLKLTGFELHGELISQSAQEGG